jgi:hypothetical protein
MSMDRRSFLLSAIPAISLAQTAIYPIRWVYFSRNLSSSKDVDDFRGVAQTAAAHGLNGILFASSFDNIDRQPAAFRNRLTQVKQIADAASIELIPSFFNAGYGDGLLTHNRNLAEGFAVNDAPFNVQNGLATLTPDTTLSMVNPGFDDFTGDKATGYQLQDAPGSISFIDTAITHSPGGASLRFENLSSTPSGNARVMQEIAVRPNRCYRASIWIRTENLQPANAFLAQVLSYSDGRALAPLTLNIKPTQDWTRITFAFNSLNNERIRLYAGTWGGRSGKFWLDDWSLEEVALVNVLRRPGAPLTVKAEADGTVYTEGVDYAPVADPQLAQFQWDHDPAAVRILPGSAIAEGDRLRISFYHAMTVLDSQHCVCMSEREAYGLWQRDAQMVNDILAPKRWMLNTDEVRQGGSCAACKARGITFGQILGEHVTSGYNIVKALNPDAEVFVWSDMFDPNHNAVRNYYLTDGDPSGSWQYLPPDINIVLWYYGKRNESLAHFSGLGFKTIAGAYYDANDLTNTRGWLDAMKGVAGASGIMYTTWENKYGLLAPFGDLVSNT